MKLGQVAVARYDAATGRWRAEYKGKLICQSQDKYRVRSLIETGECRKAKQLNIVSVEFVEDGSEPSYDMAKHIIDAKPVARHEVIVPAKPHFDVNERFEFLEELTDMVITREIPSLVVTGGAGLGKTTCVMERFHAAGLQNAFDNVGANTSLADISSVGDYIVVKGYSTARGMYDMLYWNRTKIVVFDDCDKVLEDAVAVNILKGALDSTAKRVIAWNSKMREDDPVPGMFEFMGGVIFISNYRQDDIDEAIRSRCMNVDLAMTIPERLQRIQFKLPQMLPDMDMEEKLEAFEFLKEKASLCTDMNFRTFLKVAAIRRGNSKNWRKLAEYSITA